MVYVRRLIGCIIPRCRSSHAQVVVVVVVVYSRPPSSDELVAYLFSGVQARWWTMRDGWRWCVRAALLIDSPPVQLIKHELLAALAAAAATTIELHPFILSPIPCPLPSTSDVVANNFGLVTWTSVLAT